MSRGPICVETNRPSLATPGPYGVNDAGDPGCERYPAKVRGVLGFGSPTDWIFAALPGGALVAVIMKWVAANVDNNDLETIKRIVRSALDHPEAALRNLKALTGGAFEQASGNVSRADLEAFGMRSAAAGSHFLVGITAAGMAWGFLKSIYESIKGIADIVTDLEGFIDDSLQLLEALLSPEGEEACREIGREVGGSAAGEIRKIANENYLSAAFHIGELVGPVVVGIIIAYFTAGAGAAAVGSSRFAQLLAKLRKIPKADKVLERMDKRVQRRPAKQMPDANSGGKAKAARARFNGLKNEYAKQLHVEKYGDVHHAIELDVLDRYPDVFTETELNGLKNMRGIPKERLPEEQIDAIKARGKAPTERNRPKQFHNSDIRATWDRHYSRLDQEIQSRGLQPGTDQYRRFVRKYIEDARDEIDYTRGQFFTQERVKMFEKAGEVLPPTKEIK
jgi:hypothetical protein